jgi:hypothetical protein
MFKDNTIKKGIVSSLIASIVFIIVLEPLLKFLWSFLNKTSYTVYFNYLNSLYSNAALGHRNYVDFMILTAIIAGIIGLLFITSNRLLFLIKRLKDDDELFNEKNPEKRNDIIEKRRNKLKPKIEFMKRKFILVKYFMFSIFVIAIFSFSTSLFKIYTDIQLNTSFNQRLNALAPFLEDIESKKLVSKWAMMKTKNDYIEINNLMEIVAKKNNIRLPDELIK